MKKASLFFIVIVCAIAGCASPYEKLAGAKPVSRMAFASSSQSFIGKGESRSFDSSDPSVLFDARQSGNGLQLSVKRGEESWMLSVSSEKEPFLVGEYRDAARFVAGHPLIDFTGCGRGCNRTLGAFKVLAIERGPGDSIKSAAIDFVQFDEGRDYAKVVGSFRYHSAIPITPPKV